MRALLLWAACGAAMAAEPLPNLRIDPTMTTVSGVSSGGHMAVQLHVAHSGTFKRGVGVVAAGPYYCAEGLVTHAIGRCLTRATPIPVDALQASARRWAALGQIDALDHLQSSRVYLFSGRRDTTVKPAVMDDLARWYAPFVPEAQVRTRNDVEAEHGMVTDDFGNACPTRGQPFIQDCDVDAAGEMLTHLYGALNARNDGAPTGRMRRVDQREFVAAGRGMGPEARLYVPAGCDGGGCRLHVALHGCVQNVQQAGVGETYVERSGYNRWADANRIVVLYPQTSPQALNGCWDWWGYTGPDYARRSGAQVAAIKGMVDRLAGVAAVCHRAYNTAQVWAGRAIYTWWGRIAARGSGDDLGWPWQRSVLREPALGHYVAGGC